MKSDKEKQIWEQRRFEISKEFMSVLMGRVNYDPFTTFYNCNCGCGCSSDENNNPYSFIAMISVNAADALISALKNNDNNYERDKK